MRRITPMLWYDKEAEEAANFYCSVFKNSKVGHVSRYPGGEVAEKSGQPAGTVMTVPAGWPDFSDTSPPLYRLT